MSKQGFSIYIAQNNVHIDSYVPNTYDSFHSQNNEVEILVEGVILNKKKLLLEYALSDFETLVWEIYARKKEFVINEFEGEFRGFIWNKIENKLVIFTNPTATQRVFYTKFNNEIFIDSNLIRLSENLKTKGIKVRPNIDAVYQLLCLSGMLENTTILENVYKVYDGHWLDVDVQNSCFQEVEYFNHLNIDYFNQSKNRALQEIHEVFTESVLLEYQKDDELKTDHLALLSGGLDSRVAMMYAVKNGKTPDLTFCFSQSGYLDETISRKIAKDYQLPYEFVPLDGGSFLKKIDQLTELSEGLVLYLGAIHVQHAMDNLKYQNFSIFHSGQIGDGILGGFNSAPEKEKPSQFKLVFNKDFFHKIETSFQKTVDKYESQESCLIRNLAFNRVLFGAHVLQQKAYQTSPFMTKDFMKLAKSLPEEWKFKHYFYIDWISKFCPEATRYQWERTMMKPNAKWKTEFGDLWLKRPFVKINNTIFKTPQKASMYPYQYYFDKNLDVQQYYTAYFQENIDRVSSYPELKNDLLKLFQEQTFYSKAQAVNVLAIFKLYFSE